MWRMSALWLENERQIIFEQAEFRKKILNQSVRSGVFTALSADESDFLWIHSLDSKPTCSTYMQELLCTSFVIWCDSMTHAEVDQIFPKTLIDERRSRNPLNWGGGSESHWGWSFNSHALSWQLERSLSEESYGHYLFWIGHFKEVIAKRRCATVASRSNRRFSESRERYLRCSLTRFFQVY